MPRFLYPIIFLSLFAALTFLTVLLDSSVPTDAGTERGNLALVLEWSIIGVGFAVTIMALGIALSVTEADGAENMNEGVDPKSAPLPLPPGRRPRAAPEEVAETPRPLPLPVKPAPIVMRKFAPFLDFYNLKELPFSITPDPRFLLLTQRHFDSMPFLRPGADKPISMVAIIGEPGSGKTTILRHLQRNADEMTKAGLIAGATGQYVEIYGWILQAFGIATPESGTRSAKQCVVEYFETLAASGRSALVLVDEAQSLTTPMLLELDYLANSPETAGNITVVMAGSAALKEAIDRPEFRRAKSGACLCCQIPSLLYDDMRDYITHRLSIAGATREIFKPSAIETIYYFSWGRPGLINMLCDLALAYGAGEELPEISFQTILDIVEDRDRSGLTSFRPIPLSLYHLPRGVTPGGAAQGV